MPHEQRKLFGVKAAVTQLSTNELLISSSKNTTTPCWLFPEHFERPRVASSDLQALIRQMVSLGLLVDEIAVLALDCVSQILRGSSPRLHF